MITLSASTDRFSFFISPECLSKIPPTSHHAAHFSVPSRLWITSAPGILWHDKSTDYSNVWESDCTRSGFKDGVWKQKGERWSSLIVNILPRYSKSDRIPGWQYHHSFDGNAKPIGKRIPVNEQTKKYLLLFKQTCLSGKKLFNVYQFRCGSVDWSSHPGCLSHCHPSFCSWKCSSCQKQAMKD